MLLEFGIIGAGLKFIDDAFDKGRFDTRIATAIAPVLILIWISQSMSDVFSATILFSILFATLLSGKVDNAVFKLCALATLLSLPLMKFFTWALLFLTAAGILDEKGNEAAGKMSGLPRFFFSHRFALKAAVFILCATSQFPWSYFLAILVFDLAYDAVGLMPSSFLPDKLRITLSDLLRRTGLAGR